MTKQNNNQVEPSSFRDPSGFLFWEEGILYRRINLSYQNDYDEFINSGLYAILVEKGILIPHQEVGLPGRKAEGLYKTIKPELVPFISYPYEWSFSQLKAAALTTLHIQKHALEKGMSLKDCSAYNIQFIGYKPVFIDTLSFESYREGEPWVAYKQFCQHFLAPLALMSTKDIRLGRLLQIYIDGIPLDLASSILPATTRLRFSLLSHIHLHSKAQKHYADKSEKKPTRKVSKFALRGLVDSLESIVQKLKWSPGGTEWADYYNDTNYSESADTAKKTIISGFFNNLNPSMVWDLGANTGIFSRIASQHSKCTVSFDVDPSAVEKNYLQGRLGNETSLLPLVMDLTNPSPGIGWSNRERLSLLQRGPADTVMALALIHHLAISNNLPFDRICEFLSAICSTLIIEFIPKDDSQVQRLLSTREDIFNNYSQESFESEFSNKFKILKSENIPDSKRVLYLMGRKEN